uniref:Uncharacterized protein n=1 Tax=Rhizophora mucronata TaxID=61149 RepID=A0A2P2R3Q6_RHIMU
MFVEVVWSLILPFCAYSFPFSFPRSFLSLPFFFFQYIHNHHNMHQTQNFTSNSSGNH